jgi:hypothetical protein
MTSFSDKNEVFLYSADKTGDSGFEDLLISPSPKGKSHKSKQTIPIKQEEISVIDDEDWKTKCK